MTKYVALLRGINVGGRIIKKDELKACFEKLSLQNVKAVLQSGNVIFVSDLKSSELKQKIGAALTKTFNYPAKVWVFSVEELEKIIEANPFTDAPADYHQYVIFFEDGLEKEFVSEDIERGDEEVQAGNGVVYWKVQKGMTLKSARGKETSKAKYKNSTTRTINTLKKLAA